MSRPQPRPIGPVKYSRHGFAVFTFSPALITVSAKSINDYSSKASTGRNAGARALAYG